MPSTAITPPNLPGEPEQPNESLLRILWDMLRAVVVLLTVLLTISFLVHFPYHTDGLTPPSLSRVSGDFYTKIYSDKGEQSADNAADYVKVAQAAIAYYHIVDRVTAFAWDFGLRDKRVLDVGAGTGYLQDIVDNYVGLDISGSAHAYFHKPFVQASATDMPFRDGEFDALWSIWVLEHVPKPEQALVEMRRVVKDGGLLYLLPAWNCTPWAAEGYQVRPCSDFELKCKLIKAILPVTASTLFRVTYVLPTRAARRVYTRLLPGPTRLHYNLLEPNYSH